MGDSDNEAVKKVFEKFKDVQEEDPDTRIISLDCIFGRHGTCSTSTYPEEDIPCDCECHKK